MIEKKLCLIVQRYGSEVNGGAELQCRQFAERLVECYQKVDVLTTKAVDYMTWENKYKSDEEWINGVHVFRFPVTHPRNQAEFDEVNGRFYAGQLKEEQESDWMEKQGPAVPKLIEYLRMHKQDYDAFIFFTYLYYTTAMGLPVVAEKSILIPEAHDDPFYRMHIFDTVFLKTKGIMFNTEEERELIHNKYHNDYIPSRLGGVGIELPETVEAGRFKKKYSLENYVVYVGRIDVSKNCDMLFSYFQEYRKRNKTDLKLVLMGKNVINIPEDENIISLGFVSDEDKFDGMAGARALILPSEFESLSMVVLEAMSVYTPVMVYGKCIVLKGHCIKSNGAFYFNDYFEFEGQLNYITSGENNMSDLLQNAYRYVQDNYRWDIIIERLQQLIEGIN